MSEEIIHRAPDKMMQMTAEGYLVFAWQNDLSIINCAELGIFNEQEYQDESF